MSTLTSLSVIPRRMAAVSILLWCSGAAQAAGPTGLLNDTGQTTCYNGDGTFAPCTGANTGDAATYPRQDGRFGRDAASFTKIGGGAAGFDFTRVCMSGDLAGSGTCTGTLIANNNATATADPTTDWACTKDNVTNLYWSLESVVGDWTTFAQTTLPNATNAAIRCGFNSAWRLPTRRELLSIVHYGLSVGPMIDVDYFPNTQNSYHWTSNTLMSFPTAAWEVDFTDGMAWAGTKMSTYYVRLVRSGL